MDIEKLIHTLNDIRKRASADNAEVIACAIEIVKKLFAEIMVQVGFTKLLKQKDLTNVNILNF